MIFVELQRDRTRDVYNKSMDGCSQVIITGIKLIAG